MTTQSPKEALLKKIESILFVLHDKVIADNDTWYAKAMAAPELLQLFT